MPINKSMVLKDPMNHDIPVNYHVLKTLVVNVHDVTTTCVIASYFAKAQKDWQEASYVKPPMTFTFDGIDKTIAEIEQEIILLPEWEGATIVE